MKVIRGDVGDACDDWSDSETCKHGEDNRSRCGDESDCEEWGNDE